MGQPNSVGSVRAGGISISAPKSDYERNLSYVKYVAFMLYPDTYPAAPEILLTIKRQLTHNAADLGIINELSSNHIYNNREYYVVLDRINKYCSICMQVHPNSKFTNDAHYRLLELSRFPTWIFTCCNECEPVLSGMQLSSPVPRYVAAKSYWRKIPDKNQLSLIYTEFVLNDKKDYDITKLELLLRKTRRRNMCHSYFLVKCKFCNDVASIVYSFII